MKKWNFWSIMVGLVLLISISVLSCQTNDADDYSQQAENVTAADLFITSEAHQNLEKEIRKILRRKQNAVSKFSKEEMVQYQQLRKDLLNMETRAEAKIQWNKLLGYDYYTSLDWISNLVREVYEGTDFTRLELMRARQKRKMHQVVITRTEKDEEAIQNCIEAFSEIATWRTEDCLNEYDIKVANIPFLSWTQVAILEEQYRRELEECIQMVDDYLQIGINNCESSNGRCPITVFH
ncbi:hypothetical protein AB9N12_12305 [Bacteroides sp. AN502(2024)]|uniref:hypothetical protein n=1 Tax=Bacteroides sp. AN502(2024) TaxID=3160599 RepID=UPI003519A8D6